MDIIGDPLFWLLGFPIILGSFFFSWSLIGIYMMYDDWSKSMSPWANKLKKEWKPVIKVDKVELVWYAYYSGKDHYLPQEMIDRINKEYGNK